MTTSRTKHQIWYLIGGLLISTAMTTLLAWWLWLAPAGHVPTTQIPQANGTSYQVFVYGTLRNRLIRRIVIGRDVAGQPATLEGYQRKGLDIFADPNSKTTGLVLEVTGEELQRLDRYERLDKRYERIQRTLANGEQVWLYRRLP